MAQYFNENLLLDDYPLVILPKLAVAIGLDEAIVVQRIYWLFKRPENGKQLNGHRWIFNTYQQWEADHFPFWNTFKIKRIFKELERMGILLSCQPEGRISRRKYYRLNEGYISLMKAGKLQIPEGSILLPSNGANCSLPITENTCREYIQSKETGFKKKPASQIPPYIPTEDEFNEFLEESDLQEIMNKRGNLYEELLEKGFHHFNSKTKTLEPIVNWKRYVASLDEKIAAAF